MSTRQSLDLHAALQSLEDSTRAPRMPPARPDVWLKTSPLLRRLIPTQPLIDRAERRGRALWDQSPDERERAISAIEAIVGGTPRSAEVEALARAHVVERQLDTVMFWQPWSADIEERSASALREALSGSRGVVLSACHQGPYYRSMYALPQVRDSHYSVAGPWLFEQPSHDYWGRRLAHWRKAMVGRPVPATGSYSLLAALLEAGECVYLFYDMPGQHETCFLSKTAMLADGSARLAVEADALVVPVRARRSGARAWLDALPALDSREFADADELHHALADSHERWILEEPAAMADPNSFGWENGATARGWTRP
jgi:lauroyl/myristoyl acyltransferase